MPESHDEFYIGYEPQAPPLLAARVRLVVLLIIGGSVLLGLAFALTQRPFEAANFEFGVERSFQGVIHLEPYPRLLVDRAGKAGTRSSYLLVGVGKKGARELLADLAGQRVNLRGSLIFRQDQTMIEVISDSVESIEGGTPRPLSTARSLGKHRLVGEIVDAKCFLGVMNPGDGKPHRACASLCIRGGIPPLLVVRQSADSTPAAYLLLVGKDGRPLNSEILDLVGEPVVVEGEILDQDGIRSIRVEPEDIRRWI